jgi:hypothetical protein
MKTRVLTWFIKQKSDSGLISKIFFPEMEAGDKEESWGSNSQRFLVVIGTDCTGS